MNKGMNKGLKMGLTMIVIMMLWASQALAHRENCAEANARLTCPPGKICKEAGGGSGEVPTPFEVANQKVELADGETYVLVGWVALTPSSDGTEKWKPYLEVDLGEHTWLANEKRRSHPFYPLEGASSYWRQFRGMKIKVVVQAHGSIVQHATRDPEYVIQLKRYKDQPVVPLNRR